MPCLMFCFDIPNRLLSACVFAGVASLFTCLLFWWSTHWWSMLTRDLSCQENKHFRTRGMQDIYKEWLLCKTAQQEVFTLPSLSLFIRRLWDSVEPQRVQTMLNGGFCRQRKSERCTSSDVQVYKTSILPSSYSSDTGSLRGPLFCIQFTATLFSRHLTCRVSLDHPL